MDSNLPDQDSKYHCHLYRNVGNTAELRSKFFAENIPVILLQPKYIVNEFQVQMAIFKARHNYNEKRMKTKNLQTEIIYCLSPSKNITESLKLFSSTDEDTDILIVAQDSIFEPLKQIIKGNQVQLNQLTEITDVKSIMELYQISAEELTKSKLSDSVVSRMAAKDYYSMSSSTQDN